MRDSSRAARLDVGALVASARAALNADRLDEAEATCRMLLAANPTLGVAKFLSAVACFKRGSTQKAIDLLREVVKSEPGAYEALEWLANLLRTEGKVAEAVPLAGQMTRLAPNIPSSHFTLGLCWFEQGQLLKSTECFQRAVSLAPNVSVFRLQLAEALERLQRWDEAEHEYSKAIELSPDTASPLVRVGHMLLQAGNAAKALIYLRNAAELEPTPDNLLTLGRAFAEAALFEEAEQCIRRAVSSDPTYGPAYDVLGAHLHLVSRFDEAVEAYQKAIELDPALVSPFCGIVKSKKVTVTDLPIVEKLEYFSKSPQLSKEELRVVHYALGKSYDELNQYEQSMAHYGEANRFAFAVQRKGQPFDLGGLHRWFDLMKRVYTKEFFADHSEQGFTSELPIFIVGMIRSGTTLTEQILSSHPQIGAGGELPFWTDWERSQFATKMTKGQIDGRQLVDTISSYESLLESLAPTKLRVTDKMPLNYIALGPIHMAFPKGRIIHCRRSPIDTCLSIYMTPYRSGAEFCYDRKSIVGAYKEYLRLMDHWRNVLPKERFLEVDYEDLVAKPEQVIRNMVEFCGLVWDEACLHPESNPSAVRTPSRLQVRQSIYGTSVDRWRRFEPWLGEFRELLDLKHGG